MTLRLGGDGAITGCTSLENPDLTVSGLTISGSFDAEKVLVASGTAAAPSYTFSGDTDNGLYYAGTNSIGLSTAGTSAILIDSASNVGIGTTSPDSLLDLEFANSRMRFEQESGSNRPVIRGTRTSDKANRALSIGGSDISFLIGSTATAALTSADEKVRIDSSGRLLVGTTTEGQANADNLTIADSGTCGITLRSASNNFGRIYFSDGTSGDAEYRGIIQYDHSADRMSFATNASVALTIDSSGNVGIGTSSPTSIAGYTGVTINNATNGGFIDLESNETAVFRFLTNGTVNNIETRTATPIVFLINSNERARIDSSGRLLVGTSSDFTNGTGTKLQSVDAAGGQLAIGRDTGTVNTGNLVGRIRWYSNVGGTSEETARISAEADGNYALGDKPGRLVFSTTADGESSPTERMRITSDGNVRIGTTDTGTAKLRFDNATDTTPSDINKIHLFNNGGTIVGFGISSGQLNYKAPAHVFHLNNNSEAMRIDGSGRLLVSTQDSTNVGSTVAAVQQIRYTGSKLGMSIVRDGNAPNLVFGRTASAPAGLVANGNGLGSLRWAGADGTDLESQAAEIQCQVDGSPSTGQIPGRLVFYTTRDGESTMTEKTRIGAGGDFSNHYKGSASGANDATSYQRKYQLQLGGISTGSTVSRTVQLFNYDTNGTYIVTINGKHNNQSSRIANRSVFICGNYSAGTIVQQVSLGWNNNSGCTVSFSASGAVLSCTITATTAAAPTWLSIEVEGMGAQVPRIYRDFNNSNGILA